MRTCSRCGSTTNNFPKAEKIKQCLPCANEVKYAWKQKNLEKTKASHSAYVKRNRPLWNAQTAKYRAAKLQRTVGWSDDLVISMIYQDCPEGYHVDHIIPLQGENVSGLHVAWNLQYLPASDNFSKGNRFA